MDPLTLRFRYTTTLGVDVDMKIEGTGAFGRAKGILIKIPKSGALGLGATAVDQGLVVSGLSEGGIMLQRVLFRAVAGAKAGS